MEPSTSFSAMYRWKLLLLIVFEQCMRLVLGLCGQPGLPRGANIVDSTSGAWSEGSFVKYTCDQGWLPSGQASVERTCRENGTWTGQNILCRENIALKQPTLQSGTFLEHFSHLAVDGDIDTCSWTLANTDQRWWQVQIASSQIDTILMKTTPISSVGSVSVFLIELLPGTNRAEYRPCHALGQSENSNQSLDQKWTNHRAAMGLTLFDCHNHTGEFVYIRDDRQTGEHLAICEVVVVPKQDPQLCGVPDSPVNGTVTLSVANATRAEYLCDRGLTLVGDKGVSCHNGHWSTDHLLPSCVAMNCSRPQSPANGRVNAVSEMDTFGYGETVIVLCDEGYVLSGNNTRQCIEGGYWTGPPPSCVPIICQNPAAVVNGLVELANGTTKWKAVARYQCLPGFYNYGYENTTVVYSTCQLNGTWSDVSLTCMAIPGYNDVDILNWHRENREAETNSTIIAITILSLIIVSIIVSVCVTVIVKRRRLVAADNERKISTSSTNQLLYNQIRSSSEKDEPDNNNDMSYEDWSREQKMSPYASKPVAGDEHIYSTLKSLDSKLSERRNSLDDEDDGVYATVNFHRNSVISVISDNGDNIDNVVEQTKKSEDVNDLYAKVDMNKKRNKK